MNNQNKEVEVRFLEINKDELLTKLHSLGAEDMGESMLEEVIFYDKELHWRDEEGKFVRLRRNQNGVTLTYKHHHSTGTADGTEEVELQVNDIKQAELFLSRIGLIAYRHQQKLRHTLILGEVIFDIDTWPRIPTYLEIEGPNESEIKEMSERVGLDWAKVVYDDARAVIENHYLIPVGKMKWFTFDRFE